MKPYLPPSLLTCASSTYLSSLHLPLSSTYMAPLHLPLSLLPLPVFSHTCILSISLYLSPPPTYLSFLHYLRFINLPTFSPLTSLSLHLYSFHLPIVLLHLPVPTTYLLHTLPSSISFLRPYSQTFRLPQLQSHKSKGKKIIILSRMHKPFKSYHSAQKTIHKSSSYMPKSYLQQVKLDCSMNVSTRSVFNLKLFFLLTLIYLLPEYLLPCSICLLPPLASLFFLPPSSPFSSSHLFTSLWPKYVVLFHLSPSSTNLLSFFLSSSV